MSCALVLNVLSGLLLTHQLRPAADAHRVSTPRVSTADVLRERLMQAASRTYTRTPLHAHTHAQRLPRVTCWDGTVVVEHPHVQDCPDAPPPSPAPAAPATAAPVAAPQSNLGLTGMAACIAWAESRNTPTIVNASSGAAGLFQYLPSTWQAMGYAAKFGVPTASMASVAQQVWAFNDTVRRVGYSPWAGDPCV